MTRKILFSCILLTSLFCSAQTTKLWNGKKAAVVLTYDDGLNIHLNEVVPSLDSFGLKGTFYISDYFNGLTKQLSGWKKAALKGHELANHTIWHACEGGLTGREFVTPDYDLRFYTVRRAVDEIRSMNNILKALDGKDKRTFAYPCGDTKIHDTAYIEPLRNEFVAARGVHPQMLPAAQIDLYNIPSYMMMNHTGQQMIDLVKQAMQKNTLVVFLFHGVGGEHGLNVAAEEHRKLLKFLKENEKKIWTAPMIAVGEHIKKYQSQKGK